MTTMLTVQADPSRQANDSPARPRRELVLTETAVDTARAWTSRWIRTLADDGRRVEGGWPGTVPEARARVAADAARALDHSSMPALTREELSRLTRVTYDEARRLWRASAGPTG